MLAAGVSQADYFQHIYQAVLTHITKASLELTCDMKRRLVHLNTAVESQLLFPYTHIHTPLGYTLP